jgi:hypothetical protein
LFQIDYAPHGFTSITVNLGDDWEVIKSHARLYSNLYLKDNGSVWPVYRQNGYIPCNYVIDTSGVIRYVAEGFSEPAIRQVIEQYLPDPIEHDVGVKRVVAPAGTVDSGATVVPACTVYNYRNYTETYPVRMRIGTGYDTTVTVTAHAPYTSRYVEFPQWTATERGQLTVTGTTELVGDDIASNNAYSTQVTVNVYDLAVTLILAPADTVDSGAVIVPMAKVRNLGTVADMARVRLTIGAMYLDSVNLPLQAGRQDTAVFDAWAAAELGALAVRCTVSGRWEMVPENNLLLGTVWVRSLGIQELPSAAGAGFRAHPNPFRDRVAFAFSPAGPGAVRIYDVRGRLVRALRIERQTSSITWDCTDQAGRDAGRGVFYCRVASGTFRAERKLVRTD